MSSCSGEDQTLIESYKSLQEEVEALDRSISQLELEHKEFTLKIALEEKISNLPPSLDHIVNSSQQLGTLFEPVMRELIEIENRTIVSANSKLASMPIPKLDRINKKNVKADFAQKLIENLHEMNVLDANESGISAKPYEEIHVSGSDISRMTLAYYKTLNDFMRRNSSRALLPLVIDSPVQQEQDEENIKVTAQVIQNWSGQQLFLFGKDYTAYQAIKSDINCHVLELEQNRRILSSEKYEDLKKSLSRFL